MKLDSLQFKQTFKTDYYKTTYWLCNYNLKIKFFSSCMWKQYAQFRYNVVYGWNVVFYATNSVTTTLDIITTTNILNHQPPLIPSN